MNNKKKQNTQVYEAPAIIYEGELTTRAGSGGDGLGADGIGKGGVEPEKLFGSSS